MDFFLRRKCFLAPPKPALLWLVGRQVPHCWRVYLLLVRTIRDDKSKRWRCGRDNVQALLSSLGVRRSSEGWSVWHHLCFSHGAYSCSFKESLMLMLAFHPPILNILGQCANREDSCCLIVECRQIKADRRSTATLTLGDSGLAVAEEASVSSCADVPNLGQT